MKNFLRKAINWIFLGPAEGYLKSNEGLQILILNIITVFGSIYIIAFFTQMLLTETCPLYQIVVAYISVFIFIAGFILIHTEKGFKHFNFIKTVMAVTALFFYGMLYTVVPYGSKWTFLAPLMVILVMQLKLGLIFCAIYLTFMVIAEIKFELHSLEEFTRYVCIYLAQIVLIVAYEVLRILNRDKLLEEKKKIEYLSITDYLTKLYNRRHFSESIEKEFARTARQKENLSFLMIDADKFKDYNDTYGHLQGDKMLVSIAKILKENAMRSSDAVFRMGGEEFGVLLPNTDYQGALLIAEKIRKDVSEMKVPLSEGEGETKITVSVGVASVMPQVGEDSGILLKRADNNLYKAKETGRNKVVAV